MQPFASPLIRDKPVIMRFRQGYETPTPAPAVRLHGAREKCINETAADKQTSEACATPLIDKGEIIA
jgi:hypothetical protein